MKFWLVIAMLFPVALYGQDGYVDGYILDANQNKKYCKILVEKTPGPLVVCKYMFDNEPTVTSATPEQISGYGYVDGTIFKSVRVTDAGGTEYFFMEHLVHRKVGLLRSQKEYFVIKGDSVLAILDFNHHEKDLRRLTATCPGFSKDLAVFRFSESNLKALMHSFNDCLERSPSSYVRPRNKGFEFGLFTGAEWTSLTCISSESDAWFLTDQPIYDQSRIQYGFLVRYHLIRRVTLEAGFAIKPKRFGAIRKNQQTMDVTEFEFSYSESQIPVVVQYAITGKGFWTLYGSLGIIFPSVKDITSTARMEKVESGIVTTTDGHQPIQNISKHPQYKVGLVSYLGINQKFDAFVDTSLHFGTGILAFGETTTTEVNTNFLAFSVSVGIVYR